MVKQKRGTEQWWVLELPPQLWGGMCGLWERQEQGVRGKQPELLSNYSCVMIDFF